MSKLKDKIKKLIEDFKNNRKTTKAAISELISLIGQANDTLEAMEDAYKELEKTLNVVKEEMKVLCNDYENLKKELERMKSNFWFKLFGLGD